VSILTIHILLFLLGLTILVSAADRFVVSAARIGARIGMTPIAVGAIVVGFGTSLPEFLVSGLAAADPGGLDLALGNIVGSNVLNLGLVLGVGAVMSPITRTAPIVQREGIVVLIATILVAVFAWNGFLGYAEGLILLALAVLVTLWMARAKGTMLPHVASRSTRPALVEFAVSLGALVATLIGATLLVDGAEGLALDLGVSNEVIGLTIVAFGTSLPELATAVSAARRGETEILLGNVLGSNMFNALAVTGVSAVVGNTALDSSFRPELATMVAITVLALGLGLRGAGLHRRHGALLLATYPAVVLLA